MSETVGGMQGKVVIITGGSSGIGAAAARALVAQGATVAITGRSEATKKQAQAWGCTPYLVDFGRLSEVRDFAARLLAEYPRIDVLANNVGGIIQKRVVTEDGHERTFQVNHLAPFLLTHLLQERLSASRATVINSSSQAHQMGRVDLADLEYAQRRYRAFPAYGAAKLMNILHAMELQRRYGDTIHAASFHPGLVATGFAREGGTFLRWFYEGPVKRVFMLSPEQGADTLVWLASSKAGVDWTSGGFYMKRKPARRARQARDADLAKELWEASAKMVGV